MLPVAAVLVGVGWLATAALQDANFTDRTERIARTTFDQTTSSSTTPKVFSYEDSDTPQGCSFGQEPSLSTVTADLLAGDRYELGFDQATRAMSRFEADGMEVRSGRTVIESTLASIPDGQRWVVQAWQDDVFIELVQRYSSRPSIPSGGDRVPTVSSRLEVFIGPCIASRGFDAFPRLAELQASGELTALPDTPFRWDG